MSQKEDDEGDGAGAKPNLDGVNPALGKSVPQSLPDGHTDVHGPLHYNHISQRNWEQEDQCKGRQPQPIGKVAPENPAVEPGNDPQNKEGREADFCTRKEEPQAPSGIRRDGHAPLARDAGKKTGAT